MNLILRETPRNAPLPMLVIAVPLNVTFLRLWQLLNADTPIDVTFEPIVMYLSFLHPLNAPFATEVILYVVPLISTVSGITSFVYVFWQHLSILQYHYSPYT